MTVEGTTEGHQAVLVYAANLQRSNLFSEVTVKSVTRRLDAEAASPGAASLGLPPSGAVPPGVALAPSGPISEALSFTIFLHLKPL